jgi:hypothetical protein
MPATIELTPEEISGLGRYRATIYLAVKAWINTARWMTVTGGSGGPPRPDEL